MSDLKLTGTFLPVVSRSINKVDGLLWVASSVFVLAWWFGVDNCDVLIREPCLELRYIIFLRIYASSCGVLECLVLGVCAFFGRTGS